MDLDNHTEKTILEAAEKVFFRKGKDGTSMQDIANEANITRTSLNYYYRSKDKLFEAVFKSAMEKFIPKLSMLLNSEASVTEQLPRIVEMIIDSMIEHPQIPVFVLQELSSNPERISLVYSELGIDPEVIFRHLMSDELLKQQGVDPRQLIMNVISMCIFPFAAKPLVLTLMYDGDEQAYIEAMKQRKIMIPILLDNMLKTKM